MERESFENDEIARMLNSVFIPILVDRDEHIDVDRIYLNYVQASAGTGGWPLTVFVTPDLAPVYGCTYLSGPTSTVTGNERTQNFLATLVKIRDVWIEQEERCLQSAQEIVQQLQAFTADGKQVTAGDATDDLDIDLVEEAWTGVVAKYDGANGGFGSAPKFLHAANLNFLLRVFSSPPEVRDIVGMDEIKSSLVMAIDSLRKMVNGGVHDQIGSGFHRYSVTNDWSLPHFEKMLQDQAQMLSLYLDAYLITKDVNLLSVAVDIADYLTAGPLSAPHGGFYTSEDSDSLPRPNDPDKKEGAYYVWTRKEFDSILDEQEAEILARYYNVKSHGNIDAEFDVHDEFINQNVLSVVSTTAQLATAFGLSEEQITTVLENGKEKLLCYREKERPKPLVDQIIITSYNGLAIGALSRIAGIMDTLEPERAAAYRAAAQRAAKFVYDNLYEKTTEVLDRVWAGGDAESGDRVEGFADDYVFMIWGLCHLYESTFDDSYLEWAEKLQSKLFSFNLPYGFC
jgi:uncharacterized protein YyaL (SSP411 family)